jgi:hypothetical protein
VTKEYRVLIAADTHCGHDVGLTPPGFNEIPPERAPSYAHKHYRWRTLAWEWWTSTLVKAGPFDVAIWNGDLTDGRGEKSDGQEDTSLPMQVEMGVEVVKSAGIKENMFTRGTGYHVGTGPQTWEDAICSAVHGSEIGNEGHYSFKGLQVAAKHFIGSSASPASRYTALSNAQVKQILWAETGQQPKANLIVRSHIHRCYGVSEPERNRAAWTTPALQGLGSVYGTRGIDGLPVHFGFIVLRVASVDDWGIEAYIAPLSLQQASVVEFN